MNQHLADLAAEYWEYRLRTSPSTAHLLGDHRYDDQVEDQSRAAEDAQIGELRRYVSAANALDAGELSADEQITRDTLVFEAGTLADDLESHQAEIAVNQEIGFQQMLPIGVTQFPVVTAEHAEKMVDKYRGIAGSIDQRTGRLHEGVQRGWVAPRRMMEATIGQLDTWLATPVADDRLLAANVPDDFDDAAEAAYKDSLRAVVEGEIRPALIRHRDALSDMLDLGRSDQAVGISNLPDGDIAYARAIARHTSLGISAEEIHQVGLETIAALDDEYQALGQKVLGTSDLSEIYARLREDPALHFESGSEVREASEVAMARAKEVMGDWFGTLPQADCLVYEIDSGPTAFYQRPAADGSRPGAFYVNTADPTRWGRFEIESMSFHEGIPGHHLQLAISGELEGIPEFRKRAFIAAYSEGWGLYTERLADEMGLYSSDLDRIGMLAADSMRATRLVVDTGMHAMGWGRQQAIDFVLANSPLSLTSVTAEIDRYIGWPGQAVSYMIGRKEIEAIRSDAETALSDRFDIKGFHDVVLGSGLVPLPVLRRMVEAWVAAN